MTRTTLPSAPETPGTVRDLRRLQIVNAARAILGERGLHALTFGALEERLDFTRGVITYHFRDKDEIVEAVLASAVSEIDAAVLARVRAASSVEDKLRQVIVANVAGFLDHRAAGWVLVSFWSRIPTDPHVAAVNAELYGAWRKRTLSLLDEAVEEGLLEKSRATALSATIVGVVIGIVVQDYFQPGSIDPHAAAEEAAETLVRGLRKAPG